MGGRKAEAAEVSGCARGRCRPAGTVGCLSPAGSLTAVPQGRDLSSVCQVGALPAVPLASKVAIAAVQEQSEIPPSLVSAGSVAEMNRSFLECSHCRAPALVSHT